MHSYNKPLRPPLSWYSRKPVVILSSPRTAAQQNDSPFDDELDRHVDDLLNRHSKLRIRRTFKGIWSFLKTRNVSSSSLKPQLTMFLPAMGVSNDVIHAPTRIYLFQIITGIYGFLVGKYLASMLRLFIIGLVFWGAAIVLFLAKIINLHNSNDQGFWVVSWSFVLSRSSISISAPGSKCAGDKRSFHGYRCRSHSQSGVGHLS